MTDHRYNLAGELDRLMAGQPRIYAPRDQRTTKSRTVRTGGEYDWLRQLGPAERRVFARDLLTEKSTAPGPDVIATMAGYPTVDYWAEELVAAWRVTHRKTDDEQREREHLANLAADGVCPACGQFEQGVPIGLVDIAARLGVASGTPTQWRKRGILLEPDGEISGAPWWWSGRVDDWAERTRRRRELEEAF